MRTFCTLAVLLVLSGCSQVIVARCLPGKPCDAGVHFWRPAPYVLVANKTDKDGNLTGEQSISVVYLPDKSQEYTINEQVRIGSVSMKPTLENGWNLTALDSQADSKIPETINALVGAAKLGLTPAFVGQKAQPSEKLQTGLYRIVFDQTGQVSSIEGPIPFRSGAGAGAVLENSPAPQR